MPPAKRTTASRTAKKTTQARKSPAKKAVSKKSAPAKKAAPARKPVAKKTTPAKKAPVPRKSVAKKTTSTRKAIATKKAVKKAAPTKKTPATRAVTAKQAPKKTVAKRKPASPKKTKEELLIEKYSYMFGGDEGLTRKWISFKEKGDSVARNELVVNYMSLVRYAVSRLNLALPSSLDRHDLNGYGTIGLMDAMEKFDLERGLKFETYALIRIRGAIIDELRTLDWVPRSVRTKIRNVEKATVELEHELGRTPTDDEVADRAGMSTQDVRHVLSVYANTYVGTLDEYASGDSGEGSEDTKGNRLVDQNDVLPGEAFEDAETQYEMADRIRDLEERERAVVALYYFEGLTLAEVGKVLGVTESRVCQIHTKALASLRGDSDIFRPAG